MQSKKKILIIVHIVLRFESCRSSPDRRVLSVQIQLEHKDIQFSASLLSNKAVV